MTRTKTSVFVNIGARESWFNGDDVLEVEYKGHGVIL